MLATPKHFIGDGGTTWGSPTTNHYMIDQGDLRVDEATLRKVFLPPYQAAIQAGAQSIMVSFSSWNGQKMHGQKYLLTDVLKNELGFQGFLVSDWQAIDQLPGSYDSDVVAAVNAGMDMVMVPFAYPQFISSLTAAVQSGKVPQARIDDAVRRILTVKFNLGLFEHPYAGPALLKTVGSEAHRALAREAVAKSLVLLKNDAQALPASKDAALIYVGGPLADDIGAQCGGWTIEWQGKSGDITPGTTLLAAVRAAVSPTTKVEYTGDGSYNANAQADIGIAVVGEKPYAEGVGDAADLSLTDRDRTLIQNMRRSSKKLVVVVLSGRPLIITSELAIRGCLGGRLAARHRRPGHHRRPVWRPAFHRQTALHLARLHGPAAARPGQPQGRQSEAAVPVRVWVEVEPLREAFQTVVLRNMALKAG